MVKVYIPAQESYTNSVCFPDNYYRLYNITVKDCFWISRLVMKHSLSVSELQTVCSVHVANDPFQVELLNVEWESVHLRYINYSSSFKVI